MSVRFKPSIESEFVVPKIEEDTGNPAETVLDILGGRIIKPDTMTPVDSDIPLPGVSQGDWRSLTVNLDLSEVEFIVNSGTKLLDKLNGISEVISIILKILVIFTSDLKSLSALLKTLLKIFSKKIADFVQSLTSTGIYMSIIIPDFDKQDPNYLFPTLGGFQEFKSRVVTTCLNRNDPNYPNFQSPDKVGGLILAGVAGSNDPRLLEDMLQNFITLGKLLGFSPPLPTPPENLRATAGLYRERGSREKKMGVKLQWDKPPTPTTGFTVYRCRYSDGVHLDQFQLRALLEQLNSDDEEAIEYAKTIKVYDNDKNSDSPFNSGEPLEILSVPGRVSYTHIDFDVEDNVQYFYIVYGVGGISFFQKNPLFINTNSPMASTRVTAIPRNCIPLTELQPYLMIDENGNLVDKKGLSSKWDVFTIRSLGGNLADRLLDRLDALGTKLEGLVDTPSNAMIKYIDFYSKRIKKLISFIKEIASIVQRLLSFKLVGSHLELRLPIEEGGIQGFVKRFSESEMDPALGDVNGIYFGLVFLAGLPSTDLERLTLGEDGRIKNPFDTSKYQESFDQLNKALDVLGELFGG